MVVALVLALGSVSYYTSLATNSYKVIQGDQDAAGQIANDTADYVVDEVQWSIGVWGVLEVLGILAAIGLPVGGAIAFIRKNC